MAGKPELSATTGVQNVVVYVSDGNFAQAYAVGQHNVASFNSQNSHNVSMAYSNPPHSMATVVGSSKSFPDKTHLLKPPDYPPNGSAGYFTNNAHTVISPNGFQQSSTTNIPGYQNINVNNSVILNHSNFSGTPIKNINYGGNNVEIISGDNRQVGPNRLEIKVREECDNREGYSSADSGYVSVMGGEGSSQSVRCDSVRSETAESSCSSLSSADEGLVVVQPQGTEMVVYDGSVNMRSSGVVLAVGPQTPSPAASLVRTVSGLQPNFVSVPFGWKRLVNNNVVVYISPSNAALSSLEQVKEYLLTPGTCKCGLECPLKYDVVFNFDHKVLGKPWTYSPDTNTGDLTKLCNHKRKIMAMASLDCKPPDPTKFRKDFTMKRKKRRLDSPYSGVPPVAQVFSPREKVPITHPVLCKEGSGNPQFSNQNWPGSLANQQHPANRGYQENMRNSIVPGPNVQYFRYQNQESPMNRVMMDPQHAGEVMISHSAASTSNISQHQSQSVLQNSIPNYHMQNCGPPNTGQVQIQQQQHILGPNAQVISVQGSVHQSVQQPNNVNPNQIIGNGTVLANGSNGIIIQGQNMMPNEQHQKVFINNQMGPNVHGKANVQMVPVISSNQPRPESHQRVQQQNFCNPSFQYQGVMQQFDGHKNIRPPFNMKPDSQQYGTIVQQTNHMPLQNSPSPILIHQQQKGTWQHRPCNTAMYAQNVPNVEERVPPLHQHTPSNVWPEDTSRKKVKMSKGMKKRTYNLYENLHRNSQMESPTACPNIDVRQIPNENERPLVINQSPQITQDSSSPSFMEDPSGYLAQQTALLNSTISRQTGVNNCGGFICNSPVTSMRNTQLQHITGSEPNEVPLPSNMLVSQTKQSPNFNSRNNQCLQNVIKNTSVPQNPDVRQLYNQNIMAKGPADSTGISEHIQCQGCIAENAHYQQQQQQHLENSNHYLTKEHMQNRVFQHSSNSRPNSQPSTPSSSNMSDDPVTSSTSIDKQSSAANSPDSRPIQGGTISTSNVSPADGSQSNPSTPNPHTSTTPQPRNSGTPQMNQMMNCSREFNTSRPEDYNCGYSQMEQQQQQPVSMSRYGNCGILSSGVVTTMASGRTVGSNTITSVLAGRANTSTVSVNSPVNMPMTTIPSIISNQNSALISANSMHSQAMSVNVSKSPLEMVQSVVSSIQVPQSQHNIPNLHHHQQISPLQVIKHSPTQGLPPGHILVSSGGQLIMASTSNGQPSVMPPPPPKLVSHPNSMPPISVSPMITNVTAAVTQVIPAVAQQVLGQQTVLVNALPTPFVLQPGVTMTMDGMTVGQNVQLPHLVTGNVIQQQLQVDGSDSNRMLSRATSMLSPESKKKGKKRKMSSQTIASMLQIASQQNAGVMMPQSFPQQIQMAHSPQGLTTGPVMQALTIVPGKGGGPPQLVMNGQPVGNPGQFGTQQLIANSQQAHQQINLLQPVNLINGTTGMVQNFPTIQQFIVPNLGGMVMSADGTATILQDTSNLGMQLQLQNVNGQNVLTPVQNGNMFNGGQSILAAGPAGMVIRTPGTSQGKIIQQQHSPGAQFLSPNGNQFVVNGAQFSGQLSPLVANVSPTQVTFSTAPQAIRPNGPNQQQSPEFLQCGQMGQTLMVPTANITVSSANQQNTTYVQQNTTIVQQQTTMVANNQQLPNLQPSNQQNNQNLASRTTTLNVDQNFILNSGDNRPLQAVFVQRQSPQMSANCRHSVSTQTAVNQNSHAVTTNTFCQTASSASTSSPPDTTTHSPLALEGHSPPTADTTTHSGSTDDGLSPAPSNCSGSFGDIVTLQNNRQQSCSMAMVHCISSSEPDSGEINLQCSDDWVQSHHMQQKQDFSDVSSVGGHLHMTKKSDPIHMAYAESSTVVSGIQFVTDHMKPQEAVVSSRNFEKLSSKRKHSDTLVVMENRHMQLSLFDNDEENENSSPKSPHTFVTGDLVWGPARGRPAWPGKLIEVCDDTVLVRWFGGEKTLTKVDPCLLQTLTQGLDAHHRARKNCRKSRKLDGQLENAIQEAMAELDTIAEVDSSKEKVKCSPSKLGSMETKKANSGRLRSSQR